MTNQNNLFEKKVIKAVFKPTFHRRIMGNQLILTLFRDTRWLIAILGIKDTAHWELTFDDSACHKAKIYLDNKGRTIALSSEVYRLIFSGFSPKYRPCFFTHDGDIFPGFLTKEIKHMVNVRKMLDILIIPVNLDAILKTSKVESIVDLRDLVKYILLTDYSVNIDIKNPPPFLSSQLNAYYKAYAEEYNTLKNIIEKAFDIPESAFTMISEAFSTFKKNVEKLNELLSNLVYSIRRLSYLIVQQPVLHLQN